MERLQQIKKEIQQKNGREFVGIPPNADAMLKSLIWYLDHPRLHENKRLTNEIIDLYQGAKESVFLKMEGLARKLDQLTVTLGKDDYTKAPVSTPVMAHAAPEPVIIPQREDIVVENYPEAIEELITRIESLLNSIDGGSLPQKTRDSLIRMLGFLNHQNIEKKPKLFEDMLYRFNVAEIEKFIKMQAFNDVLNMADIKLGKVDEVKKAWKSAEEVKGEYEADKSELMTELQKIKTERDELNSKMVTLMDEHEKIQLQLQIFTEEKRNFETQKLKFEKEKSKFEKEKSDFETQLMDFKVERLELLTEKDALRRYIDNLERKLKALGIEKNSVDTI